MPFFVWRFSNDFVAKRLDCSDAEDAGFVGDVTKSPVELQRLLRPVGLLAPLGLFSRLDAEAWDCKALLFSCKGDEAWTVAGRGSGEAAGDVLLLGESAECSEPFDWWCCRERRFRLTLELFWNLEGEFVVLFWLLLSALLMRQSPSIAADICVERTVNGYENIKL